MAHIRAMGPDWDLDQTTEFLVVAATLLDLKAARLLPAAEVEDEADLALLEARDLLFARLLQYRAYKQIAEIFSRAAGRTRPAAIPVPSGSSRTTPSCCPRSSSASAPEGFARLAVKAMQPKPKPQVYVDHIHAPLVSVREQAEIVVARLRERGRGQLPGSSPRTRRTPSPSSRASSRCWSSTGRRPSSLDQEEALGELHGALDAAGTGAEPW